MHAPRTGGGTTVLRMTRSMVRPGRDEDGSFASEAAHAVLITLTIPRKVREVNRT